MRRAPPRPAPATPSGEFRGGAAEVDITPPPGLPMAGYGAAGKAARRADGRLFARALFFEDGRGERAAICVCDLMSASRYLLERAAAQTSGVCGISVDRLLLLGTHTHTGPGLFYGNSLYDAIAAPSAGFDPDLADWLAARIAEAVARAASTAEPADLAIEQRPLWGLGGNAALDAWRANPEARAWHEPGAPGADPPTNLSPAGRAVDPRLTTWALRQDDRVLGVFASFSCHATALGMRASGYHPDWPGIAARTAAAGLPGSPVVAVATGAAGDINALHRSGFPAGSLASQGPDLAARLGGAVGAAIAAAARAARPQRTPQLDTRFADPPLTERRVDDRPETELAAQWCFGVPAMGGAEDGRSWLHGKLGVRAGATSHHFPPDHPQHPKRPAAGKAQALAVRLVGLAPSPAFPLHGLRIGDQLLATIPGEPTITLAHRIERALGEITGARTVTVLGYAGDYSGYFTTPEEYRVQGYEGASMLWGRNAGTHLAARLADLARPRESPPPPRGTVEFRPFRLVHRFGDLRLGRS